MTLKTLFLKINMSNAKQATISRFTNLLDGSILPRVSVSEILDYYEAKLRNAPIVVKNNCSITNKFKEAEIAEMEENEF
jgi:hypothetical protein